MGPSPIPCPSGSIQYIPDAKDGSPSRTWRQVLDMMEFFPFRNWWLVCPCLSLLVENFFTRIDSLFPSGFPLLKINLKWFKFIVSGDLRFVCLWLQVEWFCFLVAPFFPPSSPSFDWLRIWNLLKWKLVLLRWAYMLHNFEFQGFQSTIVKNYQPVFRTK